MKGLSNFEGVGEILNMHFADDTILLLEVKDHKVEALKILLSDFENMTGFKIIYHKSVIISLNISEVKSDRLASILCCTISLLPIIYLGVLIHWKTMPIECWNILLDKIEKSCRNRRVNCYL